MRWLEYYIGSLDVAANHFLTVSTTHLNPSSSPCFVFAEHASILHVLVFRASICSKSKIYVVPFLLSLVEVPVQGLVCLLRLILAHLLVIFIWTTHTTIFRLQQLFSCLLNQWHTQVRQCWGNSLPNIILMLFVLQYPKRWVCNLQLTNSLYWILELE